MLNHVLFVDPQSITNRMDQTLNALSLGLKVFREHKRVNKGLLRLKVLYD